MPPSSGVVEPARVSLHPDNLQGKVAGHDGPAIAHYVLCIVLGLALLVIAVMYFVMPADQLPGFFPGHEAGVARVHMKHGLVAGAIGLIVLFFGWRMRRT